MVSAGFAPKIIAAIDFGTHGTGGAWVEVSRLENRANLNINYPYSVQYGEQNYPKALSALLVDEQMRLVEFGHRARERWRRTRPGERARYGYAERFKMAIHKTGSLSEVPIFEGILSDIDCHSAAGREILEKLVAMTLRRVSQDILKDIGRTSEGADSFLRDSIRWCITIPAIWRAEEQGFMLAAAREAGLPDDDERRLLVKEPEAAATHAILNPASLLTSGMSDHGYLPNDSPGTAFMVVDCGGGTVDITTHQFRARATEASPLREIAVANGGPLGSAYLNEAFFRDLLPRYLGRNTLKRLERDSPVSLLSLDQAWEVIKRSVVVEAAADGTPVFEEYPQIMDLPPALWKLLPEDVQRKLVEETQEEGHLFVQPADIAGIFDSIVGRILDLVDAQLREAAERSSGRGVDYILLAGGFARSEYLRLRVRKRFGSRAKILVPQDAAVAVLRGAVHLAYNPSIIWGRLSRYTYGYECRKPFNSILDPQDRWVRDEEGDEMCSGRFSVMIERGAEVPTEAGVSQNIGILPSSERMELELYASYHPNPRYTDEEGSLKLGAVKIDMSASRGRSSKTRRLDIKFLFRSTHIRVEVKDRIGGNTAWTEIGFEELYGRPSSGS